MNHLTVLVCTHIRADLLALASLNTAQRPTIPVQILVAANACTDDTAARMLSYQYQQTVAALTHGVSVPQMILISAGATILLAVLSWHFVERGSLKLKVRYIGHTRRLFAFTRPR
jgi:hypothetical protein